MARRDHKNDDGVSTAPNYTRPQRTRRTQNDGDGAAYTRRSAHRNRNYENESHTLSPRESETATHAMPSAQLLHAITIGTIFFGDKRYFFTHSSLFFGTRPEVGREPEKDFFYGIDFGQRPGNVPQTHRHRSAEIVLEYCCFTIQMATDGLSKRTRTYLKFDPGSQP